MRYFEYSEFDSPDDPGSGRKEKAVFLHKLEHARELAKTPFKIISGYRTVEHNTSIGGSPTSSHLIGFAADIVCDNSEAREKILSSLIWAGFQRIGIAKDFIHVDCDPRKKNYIWLY